MKSDALRMLSNRLRTLAETEAEIIGDIEELRDQAVNEQGVEFNHDLIVKADEVLGRYYQQHKR